MQTTRHSSWKVPWRKPRTYRRCWIFLRFVQGFALIDRNQSSWGSNALGTPVGTLPIRYLGLPLSTGKVRVADGHPVIEKVEKRLEGWKARVLSKGGRLVLLRSVLVAIPTFYLSVFKLLVGVEHRLSGLMRRFLWKGKNSGEGRGIALVSWEDVCILKQQGGLGVLHLDTMNVALFTK